MASYQFSKPGSEFGPCEDTSCIHSDCAETRKQAATICPYCKNPIGYENRWYLLTDDDFVHAFCHEIVPEDVYTETDKMLSRHIEGLFNKTLALRETTPDVIAILEIQRLRQEIGVYRNLQNALAKVTPVYEPVENRLNL